MYHKFVILDQIHHDLFRRIFWFNAFFQLFFCFSSANIYLFKVNNRNTRKRCEISSKLTIKTPERQYRRSGVFTVKFDIFQTFFYCFYWWVWTCIMFAGLRYKALKLPTWQWYHLGSTTFQLFIWPFLFFCHISLWYLSDASILERPLCWTQLYRNANLEVHYSFCLKSQKDRTSIFFLSSF